MSGRVINAALKALDRVVRLRSTSGGEAAHIATGRSGEEAAYFYLREHGYTVVARNWRTRRRRGEIDLIGWDGDVLCFVEVKTRSTREVKPAEAAVDHEKRRELSGMARQYLRLRRASVPAIRADVISVYTDVEPPAITLFKDAFRLE